MSENKALKILGLLLLLAIPFSAKAVPIKTDFVFIIDGTSSMAGEIAGVRSGFSTFVGNLDAASVDARFSIIVYGGASELVLDFTGDAAAAQTALNKVSTGAVAGFQNNHNYNPEAGLEAIRMALGVAAVGDTASSFLVRDNVGGTGDLVYRSDARKNLILVTDENSDCPFYAGNDIGGACGSNTAASPQAEVDAAAQAVIDANAYLNMLISTNSTSESQYGYFGYDVSGADLLGYDPDATLDALIADVSGLGTAHSLQAQVLSEGLIARTFDVAGANDSDFVSNFFAAKLEEVVQDDPCDINPNLPQCTGEVPEPPVLALFTTGLLGFWYRRRQTVA